MTSRTTRTSPADELPIGPLDRDDPVDVDGWIACSSTVFMSGEPTPAERAQRLDRTAGHRVTVARDGTDVVATFRTFDSHLVLPGGAPLPVDAVSGVTVLPTHRRRGLLTRLMTGDVDRARAAGTVASILIASEAGIYARFGFGQATTAATWTLHTERARFTGPSTGVVRIVAAEEWRRVAPQVYADARARRPGTIDRTAHYWAQLSQTDADAPGYDKRLVRVLRYAADGRADGAAVYAMADEYTERVPAAVLEVRDLTTSSDEARADLWRYLASVDFVRTVKLVDASPAEPLPLLLEDPRAARSGPVSDFLWIRLHDVVAALTARTYGVPGSLVLDVSDPLDHVTGAYRLDVDAAGRATCVLAGATDDTPRVRVGVGELGSLLMGGAPGTASPGQLRAAGRLAADDDALALATALFSWPDPAWCGTWF